MLGHNNTINYQRHLCYNAEDKIINTSIRKSRYRCISPEEGITPKSYYMRTPRDRLTCSFFHKTTHAQRPRQSASRCTFSTAQRSIYHHRFRRICILNHFNIRHLINYLISLNKFTLAFFKSTYTSTPYNIKPCDYRRIITYL